MRVNGAEGGDGALASIPGEIWSLPPNGFAVFSGLIPSPLGLGRVELQDGRGVRGFICEPWGIEGARDITDAGGWRSWLAES